MGKPNWMRLVRSGESLNVEFKRQAPKLERLSRSFSAFANSSGGHIFFGIADSGDIVGLDSLKGTRELVQQVGQFYCDPPIQPTISDWEPIRGSQILIVTIPEAIEKPVYAINPHNPKDAWPFFRSYKENLPMDRQSLKTMRNLQALPVKEGLKELDRHGIKILNILGENPRVTLAKLAKGSNISSHRAKKIMVQLEQFGWVYSYFNEKRREFSLAIPWNKQ